MEEFKKSFQEGNYDNSDDTEENTFSTLLAEIEILANFQTSFKNSRTDSKILRQELQSLQEQYEEQKSKDSQLLSRHHELLSLLQEKESFTEIERAKKQLNALKRLLKLKWIKSPPNYLEGFVFNEQNGYINHFSCQITDPSITSELRNEINRAAKYSYNGYSVF